MKKVMSFILLILLQVSIIRAQELIDVYKTGKMVIQPDTEFGANNWFENKEKSLSEFSNIVISDNDDIFILDREEHQILIFDQSGDFLKKIDLNTTKSTSVYHHLNGLIILDNKYLLICRYSNIKILLKFINSVE